MEKQDSSQCEVYVINAENAAEMARLSNQAGFVTQSLGGLLPQRISLSTVSTVLDIGCGPGEWTFKMATEHPHMQVTGIDISRLMMEYARVQAERQQIENIHFRVMDACQPLAFPDNSFDLIYARTIIGFMTTKAWPTLLDECQRILRPGGTICLTETDGMGITNSAALEQQNALLTQAMRKSGQSFSPHGYTLGITPMLSRLLKDAHFQNIQEEAHSLNYSIGMPAHDGWYRDLRTAMKLLQPFLLKWQVSTQEELDILYEQALHELHTEDFCALLFFLTCWGSKAS